MAANGMSREAARMGTAGRIGRSIEPQMAGEDTATFLVAEACLFRGLPVQTYALCSLRNSYFSIWAATAVRPSKAVLSTRTTLPRQRTRIDSVIVISGGNVRVNSIA